MRDLDLRTDFTRDCPIDLERSVLLVIDVQNATISEAESKIQPFFYNQASNTAIPNIAHLQVACRKVGIEVMVTVIENLTLDGRDRAWITRSRASTCPKNPGAQR